MVKDSYMTIQLSDDSTGDFTSDSVRTRMYERKFYTNK